jgi:hypothetical protein
MSVKRISISIERLAPFHRDFFGSHEVMTYIGEGALGGKATGLAFIKDILADHFHGRSYGEVEVTIPRLVVLTTELFEKFIARNGLADLDLENLPDDRVAHIFQKAEFPPEAIGDLRALISSVHTPLAVRSSSLLEDALYEPFAGVYGTKMIPNNQHDVDTRFHRLVEAVKFVYASTFFKAARDYIGVTGKSAADERMAVIIQEVVGKRFGNRYYPHISGVARSHNFYPMGQARPEDGVVSLALGLGKTIVDGDLVWSYSPAYPHVPPPVGSPSELLECSQAHFWGINMGKPPEHDPIRETEYLVTGNLADAEEDGTLRFLASTYLPEDDRLVEGVEEKGPRVLTFSPLLEDSGIPLNELIATLLDICEEAVGSEVEIEFAVTLDPERGSPARFGFLQVRPMVVSHTRIEIEPRDLDAPGLLLASDRVLGNGLIDTIEDVVYVMPESFEAQASRRIAAELDAVNRVLVREKRPYLLIGFGRWGSRDPWLGIPVEWGQISGAKVIVETTLPGMDKEPSQGSHFFHNLTSFQVCYFSLHHAGEYRVDWDWLRDQKEIESKEFVRHVRLSRPLTVKVDGRTGRGVVAL